MNVATKAGTNQFHGSAFEFLRDGRFNAKNAFALTKDSTRAPPVRRRPRWSDRLEQAVFLRRLPGHDGRHGAQHAQCLHTDGGDAARRLHGVASPQCNSGRQVTLRAPFVDNRIDPAQFNPIALNYLDYVPVSTDPCGRIQYGYPTPSTDHQTGRLDYQLTSNHAVFARYLDINYNAPNFFDGENALTTPSVTIDNVGPFAGRQRHAGADQRARQHDEGGLHPVAEQAARSVFRSPSDMGLTITGTPLTGDYTELGVTGAFSFGGGGNNNAATTTRRSSSPTTSTGCAARIRSARCGLPRGTARCSTPSIRTARSRSTER